MLYSHTPAGVEDLGMYVFVLYRTIACLLYILSAICCVTCAIWEGVGGRN